MRTLLVPFICLLITITLIFLNMLALMRLIPLFITLPLLFLSIYVTLSTFFNRHAFRRLNQRY